MFLFLWFRIEIQFVWHENIIVKCNRMMDMTRSSYGSRSDWYACVCANVNNSSMHFIFHRVHRNVLPPNFSTSRNYLAKNATVFTAVGMWPCGHDAPSTWSRQPVHDFINVVQIQFLGISSNIRLLTLYLNIAFNFIAFCSLPACSITVASSPLKLLSSNSVTHQPHMDL